VSGHHSEGRYYLTNNRAEVAYYRRRAHALLEDAEALMFLNRLSDYFYALGRMLTAHYEVDETLWIP